MSGSASIRAPLRQAAIVLLVGIAWWQLVAGLGRVAEPWDAPLYWTIACPVALLLALALGAWFRRRAWLTGAMLAFAQLPVIAAQSTIGPLMVVGVLTLALEAIPAILAAWLGQRIVRRR